MKKREKNILAFNGAGGKWFAPIKGKRNGDDCKYFDCGLLFRSCYV